MVDIQSFLTNPILSPNQQNEWEKIAVFNGSVLSEKSKILMAYRAISDKTKIEDNEINLSTIGIAESSDKFNFKKRRQLIKPENLWEKYGCEDPRITKIDDYYYIFYTAISSFPPNPNTIKVAVAITKDLNKIEKKCLVTPFNAKAMALFPKKIGGRLAAVLTVNTDKPPAKIAIAYFDKKEDICSEGLWNKWYSEVDKYEIPIRRMTTDQVEVGAVPIETDEGWLLIYAHIQNYYNSNQKIFGIEAVLLDKEDPQKIIGRTRTPLMTPQEKYELEGVVPNVIFPSGGIIENDELYIYYGAADTYCALATCKVKELIDELKKNPDQIPKLKRYEQNPIITPNYNNAWEVWETFNPAAILLENKIHIIYRAMSRDHTSVMGYAISDDGFNVSERLNEPIYKPRESFELKMRENTFSGCEDPRITRIEDTLYMCYTAYDGETTTKIALTSISIKDFLERNWQNWKTPIIISDPNEDNKDACLLSEKIRNKYVFFHRSGGQGIKIYCADTLDFSNPKYLKEPIHMSPRQNMWDSKKIGISAPPIKTKDGWLLLYHGLSKFDEYYRVGTMLLDLDDLTVISRSRYPILEPETVYEKIGEVNNVVFPCGAVEKDGELFVYYGAGDRVTAVATINIESIVADLLANKEIYI